MEIRYPEIGICGLSCRLCPSYHADGPSRCGGCKTESRMGAGCPFITCALKKKSVEFCWDCDEHETCEKWKKHREAGKNADSFTCYQNMEEDIAFIQKNGIEAFEQIQKTRERLLVEMLQEFNEGRSKKLLLHCRDCARDYRTGRGTGAGEDGFRKTGQERESKSPPRKPR